MRLLAFTVALFVLLSSLLSSAQAGPSNGEDAVLRVGVQDEIGSRNPLFRSLSTTGDASNPTADVLRPVFSTPLLQHPQTGELLPYIAKGVDTDEDGVFDPEEYAVFRKEPGTNATDVAVYFDFNGVLWHDGTQMTVMDVLFSLQLASLSPWYRDQIRVLWDQAGGPGTNHTWDRWLTVELAPKNWIMEAGLPGSPALRNVLRFRLQASYPQFYERTLGDLWLFPLHVWEGTGGGRHPDFGRLIYPVGHRLVGHGIPVNETQYVPFDYAIAEQWQPADTDVIGSGPFRFETWQPGFPARLEKNAGYFIPDGPGAQATLDAGLRVPALDAIEYRLFRNVQASIYALQSGELDYLTMSIPPEFVSPLLADPNIRVWTGARLGFGYVAYNMRHAWTGYNSTSGGDAADSGRPLREAGAHVFDKRTFITVTFQNFAVEAISVVSPKNPFWHNHSLPPRTFDLSRAAQILDEAGWVDPPGDCRLDGTGCRSIPGRGTALIELLFPHSGIRHAAGIFLAGNFRKVGLNVVEKPMTAGSVQEALMEGTFDLAMGEWRIGQTDPDYLYTFYHCENTSPGGLNYPGYCAPEFDRVMELSRQEMNRTERQRLIRWAQGIIMGDRPVEPLYYPTAIEATRSDRFFNWSMGFGTLWNYWSWIGILPSTVLTDIRIAVSYESAMLGGEEQLIRATVIDALGLRVAGATVTLRILQENSGRFTDTGMGEAIGRTDSGGTFAATYEAPLVADSPRDITFVAMADHEFALAPVQQGFWVKVYPDASRFLAIRPSFPFGDLAQPGAPLPFNVEVLDGGGVPASDAQVEATVSPSNGTLVPDRGTAEEMVQPVFTPPENLLTNQTYRISLSAEKSGYAPAYLNVTIYVLVFSRPSPPPSANLGLQITLAAGAIGAFFAILWRIQHGGRRS